MTKPTRQPTVLVQSWVPPALGAWMKREAKRQGLTVAAWIRSHFLQLRAERDTKP